MSMVLVGLVIYVHEKVASEGYSAMFFLLY